MSYTQDVRVSIYVQRFEGINLAKKIFMNMLTKFKIAGATSKSKVKH